MSLLSRPLCACWRSVPDSKIVAIELALSLGEWKGGAQKQKSFVILVVKPMTDSFGMAIRPCRVIIAGGRNPVAIFHRIGDNG